MSANSPTTEIPPLSRWKYRARSLERPNLKTIKECVDSEDLLDLTAFAVDEIRQNGKSVAQTILALSDNLVRRIKLKNIGGPFTPELPDFTVHRQERATAIAAYVILEGDNEGPCRQYQDFSRSKGPFVTCRADSQYLRGACFNCHYSGRAGYCSFRTDTKVDRDTPKPTEQNGSRSRKRRRTEESDEYYEDEDKDDGGGEDDSIAVTRQRPVATRREGPVISRDDIAHTTTRDLEVWKFWIEDELNQRSSLQSGRFSSHDMHTMHQTRHVVQPLDPHLTTKRVEEDKYQNSI